MAAWDDLQPTDLEVYESEIGEQELVVGGQWADGEWSGGECARISSEVWIGYNLCGAGWASVSLIYMADMSGRVEASPYPFGHCTYGLDIQRLSVSPRVWVRYEASGWMAFLGPGTDWAGSPVVCGGFVGYFMRCFNLVTNCHGVKGSALEHPSSYLTQSRRRVQLRACFHSSKVPRKADATEFS